MPADRINMPTIYIGCDPEFFIRNKETKKLVSAHNLIPGTKEKPFSVPGGAIQVDGIAAEINITPATDATHFNHYINMVEGDLIQRLGDKYELVKTPTSMWDKEDWDPIPNDAKILGCNPDYDAWSGGVNDTPPDDEAFPKMRTAAGHVHVGWTKDKDKDISDPMHFEDCRIVAKQMDYFLGLYTMLWDPDNKRRSMYGRAGAFRPKKYGMEYRTPSTVWTRSDNLRQFVFNCSYQAMKAVFKGDVLEETYGDFAKRMLDDNNVAWVETKEGAKIFNNLKNYGLMPPVSSDAIFPSQKNKKTDATIDPFLFTKTLGRMNWEPITREAPRG